MCVNPLVGVARVVVCAWLISTTAIAFVPSNCVAVEPAAPWVNAAYDFLNREMDQFHTSFEIAGERDSGGDHFYPGGWMGDMAAFGEENPSRVIDDACTIKPFRGLTCIRLTYPPENDGDRERWLGNYFLWPDKNWDQPGHDLQSYVVAGEMVRVKFMARGETKGVVAEFKFAGTKGDSLGPNIPELGEQIVLDDTWREFVIEVKAADGRATPSLKSVGGGFAWVTNRNQNPRGGTIFLDSLRIEFGPTGTKKRLNEPRFVRSYVPQGIGKPDKYVRNAGFLYDQALLAMAFCARGREDDLRRARLIGDAMVYAQKKDPIGDGRLRNGYMCGDLADAARGGEPRFPGWWEEPVKRNGQLQPGYFAQDLGLLSSDVGNLSWAALSLVTLWQATGGGADSPYLSTAMTLGEWIHTHTYSTSGEGGYTGGVELKPAVSLGGKYQEKKLGFKSVEHNIDVFCLFSRLHHATRIDKWNTRAQHARRFVEAMQEADGHLWTGTTDDGIGVNKNPLPLDVASWALLAFRDRQRYARSIDWASRTCWVARKDPPLQGFDFNAHDGDGVWFEGTGQMAVAFQFLGNEARATECMRAIERFGLDTKSGGVYAASQDGLTTGFVRESGPWLYYRRLQAGGSTAWAIFGALRYNPYWHEFIPPARISITS